MISPACSMRYLHCVKPWTLLSRDTRRERKPSIRVNTEREREHTRITARQRTGHRRRRGHPARVADWGAADAGPHGALRPPVSVHVMVNHTETSWPLFLAAVRDPRR